MNVYYVSRHVRDGGDEAVVLAPDPWRARELAAQPMVEPLLYNADLIGVALAGQDESVVMSNVWHA